MNPEERRQKEARLDTLRFLESCSGIIQYPQRELPFRFIVPLTTLPTLTPRRQHELMQSFWLAHPPVPWVSEKTSPPTISDDAKRLLMLVASKPGQYTTKYYAELGWALSTGTRIRSGLEKSGLVQVVRISTGKVGGQPEIISLLPPAYDVLGIQKPSGNGHGSFVHNWWCSQIKRRLEAGAPMADVVLEKYLMGIVGKAADVGFKTEAGWVAYECQLPESVRPDLLKDMISKNLRAGFCKTVIAVVSKTDLGRVEKVVEEMASDVEFKDLPRLREQVEVRMLAEFLPKGGENGAS